MPVNDMDDPAVGAFSITPHDSNDLTIRARALYVGGSGNIQLTTWEGDTVTFTGVPAGIFPVTATRVYSTSTTATSIIGLY